MHALLMKGGFGAVAGCCRWSVVRTDVLYDSTAPQRDLQTRGRVRSECDPPGLS